MRETDTIAAIATAIGNSGINIIRVSGQDAVKLCDGIFSAKNGKKLEDAATHTIHYGNITDDGRIIDEVLVSVMRAPNTYTREDVVEINCHGGARAVSAIMSALFKAGANPAEPGEFTKRAFVNGRIDLTEAEAVNDIINARTELALENAESQLKGNICEKVKELRAVILNKTAYIEAALDDPEHISLEGFSDELSETLAGIRAELKKMLEHADEGRVLSEGINTVILGKPNVGKSSLLNVLSGSESAIVTDVAGTTRDVLTEHINIRGLSLNIADTAGIRGTDDPVERIGVERAREAAEKADLIIFVADGLVPLDEQDREIIGSIDREKTIFLLNKTDEKTVLRGEELERLSGRPVIEISAKEETGIEILKDEIEKRFALGEINFNDDIYITNARQKSCIESAYRSILKVEESISADLPEDFFSIDLRDAYESLGQVIGESVEDDLADEIFLKFCMGK